MSWEPLTVLETTLRTGRAGIFTLDAGGLFPYLDRHPEEHDELPAADVYVLMEIIHDGKDADAIRILQNVRRNAADDAVVLILEAVLSETPEPDQAKGSTS